MSGTSTTQFAPDETISRAQLVTMLYRLADQPETDPVSFSDVSADAWYADAASWATEHQLLGSDVTAGNAFSPEEPVTRAQIAGMLYRYAGLMGYDRIETEDLSRFTDLDSPDSETRSAIAWASASGILRGTSDTAFSPEASVTRAQAAAVFHRFCSRYTDSHEENTASISD